MDILNQLYYKSVNENEANLRFWDGYLQSLKSLDFNTYSEKLKVPILVPIGSRILFRGELKHTNEVTVALGADYFVKCSLKQADIIRQHRIKGAQEKVDAYTKERDYLQNQMTFTKENVYENQGQEIIEHHTEEEDKAWREKHRANVREYMQNRAKEKKNEKGEYTADEELWNRLEELELQEELLNEYDDDESSIKETKKEPFIIQKEEITKPKPKEEVKDFNKVEKEIKNKNVTFNDKQTTIHTANTDLLQKVIDKQNELDEKLHELKNRKRGQSKTEEDLIAKLDELEQLDELEDEMDRLDDIIQCEDSEETEESDLESNKPEKTSSLRRVSFVDEDDSETLELTFKHSDTEPNREPYDPEKGIQKPSDIYKAYSNLFGTTSILKKSKYAKNEVPNVSKKINSVKVDDKPSIMGKQNSDDQIPNQTIVVKDVIEKGPEEKLQTKRPNAAKNTQSSVEESLQDQYTPVNKTIVIKDVVEKVTRETQKEQTETKPVSLFKKKRMQNKS